MKRETDPRIAQLLHVVDEGYGATAWHGPNFPGALKGVTVRAAAWRPAPGRHNIRELVAHSTYWKERVRRRLTGEKNGPPVEGSNFADLSDADGKAWRAEQKRLDTAHGALREAVERFPADRLLRVLPGTKSRTALREIAGIALHDVYHAGQVQLLKALQKKGR